MSQLIGMITPARLKSLLRSPGASKVLVIDVRDSDFAGGHIRGARNITVNNFSDDYRVDSVVEACRGMDTVVLHCYLSQQRGPFAAQRLAARLAEVDGPRPEVCVLAGGWRRFCRELEEQDSELVEDYAG